MSVSQAGGLSADMTNVRAANLNSLALQKFPPLVPLKDLPRFLYHPPSTFSARPFEGGGGLPAVIKTPESSANIVGIGLFRACIVSVCGFVRSVKKRSRDTLPNESRDLFGSNLRFHSKN